MVILKAGLRHLEAFKEIERIIVRYINVSCMSWGDIISEPCL